MTFARIGIFEVPAENIAAVVALFRDRITPLFAAHEGFEGYQAFTDMAGRRYVGISYWASLDALQESGSTARSARGEAAALGARTIGEPLITKQEFDRRAEAGRA